MEILIIAMLIGLIPAFIANSKGRSFLGWWIYGTLLFIIAFIHSLFISSIKTEASAQGSINTYKDSASERLKELSKLREKGMITEQEFQEQRRMIIGEV